MELIAQNKWIIKVIAFFAVVGMMKTAEIIMNRELLDKQNFISLVIVTTAIQIFSILTK